MLTIPMNKEGFEAVTSGRDKEIYLIPSAYWLRRISNLAGLIGTDETKEKALRAAGRLKVRSLDFKGCQMRTGNNREDHIITFDGYAQIRTGREEWGAEPGREYIVLVVTRLGTVQHRQLSRTVYETEAGVC